MRIEEKILLNELKNRNKSVFKALFSEYYLNLVGFAKNYLFDQQESESLVQELFIFLWENIEDLRIHKSLKAYLYSSVKNRCLNHLKQHRITDKKNLLYIEALIRSEGDSNFYDPEILNQIKKSVQALPPQMARVFVLRFSKGMKQQEIADELNISVSSVKTQLQRARARLRKSLLLSSGLLFCL